MIGQTERIDVRKLAIKEPVCKKEPGFDPTAMMTEADWDAGLRDLDISRRVYDEARDRGDTLSAIAKAEYFAVSAFSMSIVQPGRHFCSQREEKILWEVAAMPGATRLYSYHFFPNRQKLLTSDEAAKFLSDVDFTNPGAIGVVASYRMLYPEIPISSEVMQDIKNNANSQISGKTRELGSLASVAALYKLASGNIADLGIDFGRFWKIAEVSLENNFNFNLAADLKILHAEKIEFTGSGLVLTMPATQLAADTHHALPAVRRF